jgi:hypothetical protein
MSTRSLHIYSLMLLAITFQRPVIAGTIVSAYPEGQHNTAGSVSGLPSTPSSRPVVPEREDLFGETKDKDGRKLFTALYQDLPDFKEESLKREKFDVWMDELKDSPKPKEEILDYLGSLSPQELTTLIEKMEKTGLSHKGEKQFKKLVAEVLEEKQKANAKQVADLKKFLDNPGRFAPPTDTTSAKKETEFPDLGLPPEQWAARLTGAKMPVFDPAQNLTGKKYIVLGGSVDEFGRTKEDPDVITYYEINPDGSVTKTGESLSSNRKVENIQHSFTHEELEKANPGMVASFMIGAMKHALPAAANTVALAGLPGLGVSMALHEGAHQIHNQAFLMLPREQQAAVTAALHSNAGNAGGWVGFGGSLVTPFAGDIAKGRLFKHSDHAVEKIGEKVGEHQLMAKHGHSVSSHGGIHPTNHGAHGLGSELHFEPASFHPVSLEPHYPSLFGNLKSEGAFEATSIKPTPVSVTQSRIPTYRPARSTTSVNTPVFNLLTAPVRIFRRP